MNIVVHVEIGLIDIIVAMAMVIYVSIPSKILCTILQFP